MPKAFPVPKKQQIKAATNVTQVGRAHPKVIVDVGNVTHMVLGFVIKGV